MHRYSLVPSSFGELAVVWQEETRGPVVQRVLLPDEQIPTGGRIMRAFPGAIPETCQIIDELSGWIGQFLAGEDVRFALDTVALDNCAEFQQRVLRAEYKIPRGCVSSYGRIARHLELPKAARAVGHALAGNPFPIIIPCHRAIRSDGHLGGFQGGPEMKRALLEMEGVEISPSGKIPAGFFYY